MFAAQDNANPRAPTRSRSRQALDYNPAYNHGPCLLLNVSRRARLSIRDSEQFSKVGLTYPETGTFGSLTSFFISRNFSLHVSWKNQVTPDLCALTERISLCPRHVPVLAQALT
jgi:hypothetical protein